MSKGSSCSTCGRPVTVDGLGGLCASCLLEWSISRQSSAEGRGAPTPGGAVPLNIPGYVVHEEIARGGMGIVYRSTQSEPRREVALKMLLPHQAASPERIERFRMEARAVAVLEHPAILPVYQVGEHSGLPFFTMKLAGGGSLAQRSLKFRAQWREIAELVATLADAVQFAHERGVLHRDLKPGNILFDESGRVFVSDFGLAKFAGAERDLTHSREFLGTPHYVAPEIALRSAKDATTASDIYSLGAILYELLAGHPPFEAEGIPSLLKKIVEDEPVAPSCPGQRGPGVDRDLPVPWDLEVICLKCLAKEPARRYATAHELGEDLRRWLDGRPILARPASRTERIRSWARRNPALAVTMSMLALVLITALILQARANRRLELALLESLLRQAQLKRASATAGQRFETLSVISQAAQQLGAIGRQPATSNLVLMRSEAAAALALADVRLVTRWPVSVRHLESEFDFSRNLDRYAVSAPDGGIALAATRDRTVIAHLRGATNNPAIKLRLHPDGSWVGAGLSDGQIELYAVDTKEPLVRTWKSFVTAGPLFAFAPPGKHFGVMTHAEGDQRVEILDLSSREIVARLPAQGATTLVFDPSGTQVAVAGAALSVWHLRDTNRLWSFPLSHEATALAWSTDGRHLAVALDRRKPTGNGTLLKASPVLIVDATNGRQESVFGEFGSPVDRLAFHPSSRWLAVATWENGVLLGSLQAAEGRLPLEGAHRVLAFAADGRTLGFAPTREELGLLEVAVPSVFRHWQMAPRLAEDCQTMDSSPAGRWVATASSTAVHLWDGQLGQKVDSRALPTKGSWVEVLFGPSNECVYGSSTSFGVRRIELVQSTDGGLKFGEMRAIGPTNRFLTVGFAYDGRSLVVTENQGGSSSGLVAWLWPDADPGRARKLASDHPLLGYIVVPGSRWAMTTALVAPDVSIWNFDTGERVHALGLGARSSGKPSPNGRWLVAKTADEFGVWEVGTWKALVRGVGQSDETPMNLVCSPDSRIFVTHTPGGRFVLRGLPDGREIIRLTPPQSIPVQSHQFTADGGRLIFMGNNGELFEWNLPELRRELGALGLDWD